ncbi:ERF family protein [Nocardiopsis alba]|uniref:ERF family protein n=1 Tax=Nocardiopsis alba TaxID=53437 RepID=UPI0035DB8847
MNSAVLLNPAPAAPVPAIYGALVDVMSSVGAVGKGSINKQQGYRYRGIDDVMTHVHAAMVKHRVVVRPTVLQRVTDQRPRKEGGVMYVTHLEIRYRWISAVDGSHDDIVVWGEGADTADKSTSKAQSMALKYGLLHSLMIPTEDIIDGDADHPDPGAPSPRQAPAVDAEWVIEARRRIGSATGTDDLSAVWDAIGEALSAHRIDRPTADALANEVRARSAKLAEQADDEPAQTAPEAPHGDGDQADKPTTDQAPAPPAPAAPPPGPERDDKVAELRARAERIAAQHTKNG